MADSISLSDRAADGPLSAFAFAKDTPHGKRPQAIAHRGYTAAFPENTISAFKAAVEVGAHALELDLQLTKDGVVVISHDPTLKRCFGEDKKIIDCDWAYIQTLRTIQKPHQSMPSLKELLEWLATAGLDEIWILLDVKLLLPTFTQALFGDKTVLPKLDNYADDLFRLTAATLASVRPSSKPWSQRVMVGHWAAKYLPLGTKYLSEYPSVYIGFSIGYARQFLQVPFLQVPGVNISMFIWLIVGPRGSWLLRDVKRHKSDRAIFLWTVNSESWMKWSIRQGVDGVITDDPKTYLEVYKNYQEDEKLSRPWATWKIIFRQHLRVLMHGFAFRIKHGWWVDVNQVKGSKSKGLD